VSFQIFCEILMVVAREYYADEDPVVALALLAKALHFKIHPHGKSNTQPRKNEKVCDQ
jgi:hypothetical protein